jgi:hypothetical protein
MDQKFEIIVKILTKLIEKHQNIHTMGQFSEKVSCFNFQKCKHFKKVLSMKICRTW